MADTVGSLPRASTDHLTFEFLSPPFLCPPPRAPLLIFEFLPLPAWGRGRLLVALTVFELFFHVNRGLKPPPPNLPPPHPTPAAHPPDPPPTRVPLLGPPGYSVTRRAGTRASWSVLRTKAGVVLYNPPGPSTQVGNRGGGPAGLSVPWAPGPPYSLTCTSSLQPGVER